MTNRRTFLAGTIAATATAAFSGLARAEGTARISKIKAKDGTELFIRDTGGNGRAVVMTHAWPLSSEVWNFRRLRCQKRVSRGHL